MQFIDLYRTSQAWRYGAINNDFRDLMFEDEDDSLLSLTSQERVADSNNSVQQAAINDKQSQLLHNVSSS